MVQPLNMVAMQSLGEPDPTQITKTDLLTALSFDRTGRMLSVGDNGGRVIIFNLEPNDEGEEEFAYLTELYAHKRAMDVLSSTEISETVSNLEWVNKSEA